MALWAGRFSAALDSVILSHQCSIAGFEEAGLGTEQRVELFLNVVLRGRSSCDASRRARTEVVAIVRGFLIPNPFGLGFRALVVFGRIVELAVAAGMKISATLGTFIAAANALARRDIHEFAAFPTMKRHC